MNGQWNTDITDNCSTPNPNIILTTTKNDINFMADTTSITDSTVTTEDELPAQVNIPALVIAVAVSVIGTIVITFFIGLILVRLCKTNSKQNIPVPEENVMGSMKGPVYEEVELEDKIATIDLSQNIAYGQAKKTVS